MGANSGVEEHCDRFLGGVSSSQHLTVTLKKITQADFLDFVDVGEGLAYLAELLLLRHDVTSQ